MPWWTCGLLAALWRSSSSGPLFDGDDDNDLFLRIFRVLGVPGRRTWPAFNFRC
jgi:cell division cycle 2-like protein